MVVVTSPSDLFSSSNLKLCPTDVARDEIQFNHTAHPSLFVPSYLGTAANIVRGEGWVSISLFLSS